MPRRPDGVGPRRRAIPIRRTASPRSERTANPPHVRPRVPPAGPAPPRRGTARPESAAGTPPIHARPVIRWSRRLQS